MTLCYCMSCGETAEGNDTSASDFRKSHTKEDCPASEPVIEILGPGDLARSDRFELADSADYDRNCTDNEVSPDQ